MKGKQYKTQTLKTKIKYVKLSLFQPTLSQIGRRMNENKSSFITSNTEG